MTARDTYIPLRKQIDAWAYEAGFSAVGVTDLDLSSASFQLHEQLNQSYQAQMHWMADRIELRENPPMLLPGAVRAICFRMNYLPADTQPLAILDNPDKAYISRYALGRDYHKLIRRRLADIATKIQSWCEQELQQRPFVDSAPVMEKPLAAKAGLGWMGKNTLLLQRDEGSWFFLGEILTSLELPLDEIVIANECGKCKACMTCCPTDAFPQPYVLDARRCISWLTIENDGAIAEEFRKPMGNRIFGCDDCQLVCPWNRNPAVTRESAFKPRHGLEQADLVELFNWNRSDFESRTAGSPIRRAGYEGWQRNLAVALGNGSTTVASLSALRNWQGDSPLVREHIEWALNQLKADIRRDR